jgi:predicted nucleotidyltransferase
MRISSYEQKIIKTLAKKIFGTDTHVFLFGSRTMGDKKGGDIDLFITNKNKENLTTRSKITFLAELKASIGDQKIDVILDTDATKAKENFYRSIKSKAVEL